MAILDGADKQEGEPKRAGERRLLAAVVVLLGAAAGSFVARNSDFWLHLAAGRLLVQGEYRFGVDPFAAGTAGKYWANHAWLWDVMMYVGWETVGGPGLVGLKALLAAVLAGVLLGHGSRGAPLWLAGACVLLAVVAMTPRLLLQPFVASLLLLAAVQACLHSGGRIRWLVVPLTVLWVNLDAWFVLAPLAVLLDAVWLRRSGRAVQAGAAERITATGLASPAQRSSTIELTSVAARPGRSWLLVGATLLATLVNPHLWHAWTWPTELSPAVWRSGLASDPRLAGLLASPWPQLVQGSVAAAAFGLLLVLSGAVWLSGLWGGSGAPWRRPSTGLWLLLAAGACWQARLIPLFAVVAAPLLAQAMVHWPGTRGTGRWRWQLTAASGLVLLVAYVCGVWPRDRLPGWDVWPQPGLQRLAQTLQEQAVAAKPLFAVQPLFTAHPDIGHYLAWFAPGVQSTIDSRLQLFAAQAESYRQWSQRTGLLPTEATEEEGSGTDFVDDPPPFAAVVVYDPDVGRMNAALQRLVRSPRWEIVAVAGAGVVARLRPAASAPSTTTGPSSVQTVPSAPSTQLVPSAPSTSSVQAGRIPPARIHQWLAELPRAEEGVAELATPSPWGWGSSLRPVWRRRTPGAWTSEAASIYLRLQELADAERSVAERAAEPPLLAWAAVRSARAGLEHRADDALAWSVAARALRTLRDHPWESEAAFPLLVQLRQCQIMTALTQAAVHQPDNLAARELLLQEVLQRSMWDVAREVAADIVRLHRRRGRLPNESPEQFAERLANSEQLLAEIERQMFDNQNRLRIRSQGLGGEPLARARIAAQLGLPAAAIDILQTAPTELYGPEGIVLLLELLVQTGRTAEARLLLDREELRRRPLSLGTYTLPAASAGPLVNYQLPAYYWFELCTQAAAGRAGAVREVLAAIREFCVQEQQAVPSATLQQVWTQAAASEIGLGVPPALPALRLAAAWKTQRLGEMWARSRGPAWALAEFALIESVLEMEWGNVPAAHAAATAAVSAYDKLVEAAQTLPGTRLARRYQQLLAAMPPGRSNGQTPP